LKELIKTKYMDLSCQRLYSFGTAWIQSWKGHLRGARV